MPFTTLPSTHKIHYHDTHPPSPTSPSPPPLILIHGLGSSQNYYSPVIPHLPNHRCIALDTYGAARSKSQGEDLSLDQLADDVIALMDHLKIQTAVVVGHSMGGPMALTVAAKDARRVVGVVAVGPVDPRGVKGEVFKGRIETVLKDGMEPLANTVPTAATNKKSTALQKALIRELILNQEPRGYASHCNVIVTMKEPKGGFEAVKCPVVILAGDEDQSAPMEGCKAIYERLGSQKKELVVMQGVGHWHCVEDGEGVARAIEKFVEELVKS